MGRKKNFELRKYFEKNGESNNQLCTICKFVFSGDNVTNMAKHFQTKHEQIYTEIQMKQANAPSRKVIQKNAQTVHIKISEEILWDGCLEMVSAGGLPFSFINNRGFRKILAPITEKMNVLQDFNVTNLKKKLSETAEQTKSKIKNEIKNQFVSLKMDAASRHMRSILGINVQYVSEDFKIKIKTLAMKELTERHTSAYLKTVVLSVLNDYDISLKQVYCITSDNGRNMIKATKLLHDNLEEDIQSEMMYSDSESENGAEEFPDHDLNGVENSIVSDSKSMINCMRCAAHTLQLVVNDAIQDQDLSKKLLECKKIAIGEFYFI